MADDHTIVIKDTNELMDIPPEGCLGLLALGDVGVKIWREKVKSASAKATADEEKKENKEPNE